MFRQKQNINIFAFYPSPEKCPVCQQSPDKEEDFLFRMNYQKENEKFSLYECPICRVQFWLPFKNPGSEWYEKYQVYEQVFYTRPKIRCGYHRKTLRIIEGQLLEEKNFLDLGCGTGEFISLLKQKGLNVWGIDFSRAFIDIARKNFNLENLFICSFSDFFQKTELPRFDYISFFEVLEHLDNPQDFIQGVKKFLKPRGKIFLSVPCRERILINWVEGEFPYHHLSRWNQESLVYFLDKNGFEIKDIYYVDSFRFIYDTLKSKMSFGLLRKVKKQNGQRGRGGKVAGFKNKFLTGLLYFFISFKKVICFIFALILFILSKLFGKKNGDILCLAKLSN